MPSVTIEIPSAIQQALQTRWGELPRRVLEAVAAEAYRQEALTRGQVGELLGLSFWQTETFLKEHGASLHYDARDLEADRHAHAQALAS